ncbi:MAG TPA: hypothetical protein VHV10_19225, partial [Ktedonobacteraceae bacterium]|nr:hypothetical protein [Ktedonobacteraceae bacterium]
MAKQKMQSGEKAVNSCASSACNAIGQQSQKVHGEAYCIGYIDAPERSYGVYQIHTKTAFSSGKLALSLLFVLDNNVFHEHEEW